MNRMSNRQDLTAKQPTGGGGMDCRPMWLCGHKSSGGQKRRVGKGLQPVMWRCANCAKEKA